MNFLTALIPAIIGTLGMVLIFRRWAAPFRSKDIAINPGKGIGSTQSADSFAAYVRMLKALEARAEELKHARRELDEAEEKLSVEIEKGRKELAVAASASSR